MGSSPMGGSPRGVSMAKFLSIRREKKDFFFFRRPEKPAETGREVEKCGRGGNPRGSRGFAAIWSVDSDGEELA